MQVELQTTLDGLEVDSSNPVAQCKHAIKAAAATLAERFRNGDDVVDLVHDRATFIDGVLQHAWQMHVDEDMHATLVAVGGYGRGELHPGSDVDVLILTGTEPEELAAPIEGLVMFLWDIGLEVGHSVRTVAHCVEEATSDLTIVTNLMEARHIAGAVDLYDAMLEQTAADRIWPADRFFSAKVEEQHQRHHKFVDSGYNLEPNVKANPGGLRDIQMIGWVAKRHFGATRFSELRDHGFLTDSEYRSLKEGEKYLWNVRFALHLLTGRHEDRLLFEYQRELAAQFGYADANTNLAVEQFMQRYYRTVRAIQQLNELLMQLFNEAMLLKDDLGEPVEINRRFQARGGYVEVRNPGIFARYPLALLELFLVIQQREEILGIRAGTIRLMRAHRHLIDARFRDDLRARSLFMEILRQPQGITHALRGMHRFGILQRYIPAFGKVAGLMQFDLYHMFTVDEHILMVLRNTRRIALAHFQDECPRCHEVFQRIPKPELLYLAALFHDIAKGRGGDHANLGAKDALAFCKQHALPEFDSRLVSWLVESHLVMSHTAQRKDIDDPEVVQAFATLVGDKLHLDYLYLLTVADIRGTNPARWSAWKAALLARLHESTLAALERGLDRPRNEDDLIHEAQHMARIELHEAGLSDDEINLVWLHLTTDYFLQTRIDNIVWHTIKMLHTPRPIRHHTVYVRDDIVTHSVEFFLIGPDRDDLFAHTAALLDSMSLDILGARIGATNDALSINSFYVVEDDDGKPPSETRKREIKTHLEHELNRGDGTITPVRRHVPRHLKSFRQDTQITFEQDAVRHLTRLTLLTDDHPELLTRVGIAFARSGIRVHNARIVTEGTRARDIFMISDRTNQPIEDSERLNSLERAICEELETD